MLLGGASIMIDLNALKRRAVINKQEAKYFGPGRYTCRVLSIDYVARQDTDDLLLTKFYIEEAYPGSENEVGDVIVWGKKLTERNIIDLSDMMCSAAGEEIDLNSCIDTNDKPSAIKDKFLLVEVKNTTWNGKPFASVKFAQKKEQSNEWGGVPWDKDVKPF